MKTMNSIFKMCLFALSMSVISCTNTELEDLSTPKNELQQNLDNDDISYVGSDTQMGDYLDEVANQIRAYKKVNPDANDNELNLLAEKILHNPTLKAKHMNARTAYTDMDGYVNGYLNAQERALYNSNKAKALLCMANGKFALSYAESNYIGGVLHNGNGDAFRHTLWNFGMTIDVGSSFAKTWSDAHEYGTSGQPAIEKTMDLYNNSVGIQLGRDNPNTFWHGTFVSKTKEKVRGGKLYVISSNKLYWSNSYGEK
jgi:hypothetical protein